MPLTTLDHYFVRVKDLERSRCFYCAALGQALGTLLVFVTLIYLAIQTQSLKKQSEAEARYAFVDAIKLLPEHSWTIVRNDIASILGSNGGTYFWKNGGAAAFDPGFVGFVRATLASGHRPYDMAAIAEARN